MLMELLGRRSPAPAQDVARRILGEDVTQIEYYTERVKRMVGKVLTGNGITRYDQGAYDLVGGVAEGFCAAVELSDAERDQLLQLCRQRLDAFREQRGEEVGCLLTQKPAASGTGAATAPRSAARSKSGCSHGPRAAANAAAPAVAWQALHQRALEVDHIVPRNQGGSDDLSNLQALCFRCNAGKRWEARGGMCVLRAGGQRPGAAGERTGAMYRRCLSGVDWAQPGDPATAWGRWVGVAPAGMERGGGCGPSIPKPDQVGWNGSMECSTPPRACLASFRSWLACILSQKPSLRQKKRHRRRSVSALIVRRPFTIALMRLSGTPIASASRY